MMQHDSLVSPPLIFFPNDNFKVLRGNNADVSKFLEGTIPLPWSNRIKIALGAAKGLAFLHGGSEPVIYRDFKTSNILLDSVC